ncbi:MAG: hypothetical protein HY924_13620 [Elusimicrobia bacterium]|nr:hypothetical protein [Elusimicrobiota bacterium]
MRSSKKTLTLRDCLPWLAGTAAGLCYLATRSYFFNFDGVACAIAVELSDWKHLVHGNHLGYGVLGWLFFKLWQIVGYSGTALYCLQVLDSLLGGASVGVFCSLLLLVGASPVAAFLASAGLAVSYAWWFWSLEAQVYMLGCLFLALSARSAFSPKPDPVRTGLWQALAILGHVGHLMFAPACLYLLARSSPHGSARKAWKSYALALGLPVLAAYILAGLLCARPTSLEDARVWLLGSAALNLDKSFSWFGGWSWVNLGDWLRMSLRVFTDFVELPPDLRSAGWLLASAPVAAGAAGVWLGRDRLSAGALLWLGGYALLYTSWQPHTIVYRVSDLMAVWLLVALLASSSPWRTALLAVWVGGAGFFNWTLLIEPWTRPESNPAYKASVWLNTVVPENGWVAAFNLDQVYIPYFGQRKPLNVRYYEGRLPVLAERIESLSKAGEPVFATSRTLEEAWGEFLRSYELVETARSPEGVALYRLASGEPGSRAARAGARVRR